ncbi:peptidylprolyl isomerase [Oscillibacter sp.]|uniref:peptidylprolyl isomerase n=1 Tax=Oscillibacter sp. TaxID=1945593 RepID=UPI0026105AA4|nr:peptidylprolyl isomerase [Oscillibacter sp.]MDD3347025.1 peptidylprolyl isomerase [Oscillibacter sp.]
MKKCVCALALGVCLFLTACGGKGSDQSQTSFLGEAADLEETAVLVTVDGRKVSAWRYLYWLADTCDGIQEQYEKAGLRLDWNTPVTGGTLADYARDQALANTALYATVENWAVKYGCALSESDREALEGDWAEETKDGEDAFLRKLRDRGLNRERMEELQGVGGLYAKLFAQCQTPGSALAPDPAALKAFAEKEKRMTLDRILVAVKDDRAAAQQRAAELFSQLNSAEDQASLFAALSAAGDDPKGPRTVTVGDGALSSALEEAAATLEEGQCSGILESEEGFSILRRLPVDSAVILGEYFDSLLEEAAKGAVVEEAEAYQKIDPADFFEKLQSLRESADS